MKDKKFVKHPLRGSDPRPFYTKDDMRMAPAALLIRGQPVKKDNWFLFYKLKEDTHGNRFHQE